MNPLASWCLAALVVGGPMLAILIGSMIANADRHECFDVSTEHDRAALWIVGDR